MKKEDFIKSEPTFFRMITFSGAFLTCTILFLAIFIDAPLEPKADFNNPANPAKAAWFLIWIQEVVSYSAYFIYAVIVSSLYYFIAPFIHKKVDHASWFDKNHRIIQIVTLIIFLTIIILTLIAIFLRGKNWVFMLL